jgi:hypothetical protein
MNFALDIDLWSKHLFQTLHNEAVILNIGVWILERLSLIILIPRSCSIHSAQAERGQSQRGIR